MTVKIPVISYHKIDFPTSDVKIRGAFTSPRRFARQISYLKQKGLAFYTASELVDFYLDYGRFPTKGISITFDDGWKDNYTNAFPVLRQHNIKATIFLVPSCIDRVTDKVTAEGEAPREHLSEENIREMSAAGIEFGSHSMSHQLFHQIGEQEIEYELDESRKYIENLLQKECRVFAYPAGFFTDFAKTAVKNAGYTAAFSTVYGPEGEPDIYALNRSEILRRDGYPFRFGKKVNSLFSE